MKSLASIITGSRAYGTNLDDSDVDMKSIHVPSALDILLQRVPGSVRIPGDDHESYSLHNFLNLVAEGQPIAIELLCSPPSLWVGEPSKIWCDIVDSREVLLTARSTFTRYSQRQATSPTARALRFQSLRTMVDLLSSASQEARIESLVADIEQLNLDGVAVLAAKADSRHGELVIGDKRFRTSMKISDVYDVLKSYLTKFGARSIRVTEGGGVDWKAMMHAVRLAEEGIEYHNTGNVTLPRPNAEYLRAIRLGQIPLNEVVDALESATEKAAEAQMHCTLRSDPDMKVISRIVSNSYANMVIEKFGQTDYEATTPTFW